MASWIFPSRLFTARRHLQPPQLVVGNANKRPAGARKRGEAESRQGEGEGRVWRAHARFQPTKGRLRDAS